MQISSAIESAVVRSVDLIFKYFPQPVPCQAILSKCKIISHRGDYDNADIFENTMAAFHRVQEAGVWGIECDVRWTRDLHPIVFHDMTLYRLFDNPLAVRQLSLAEIKRAFPCIPTLSEVVQAYGGKMHLMVELKNEFYPAPARQNQILAEIFNGLSPGEDFHLMSLLPQLFNLITFTRPDGFIPIARLNCEAVSRQAIKKKWGGIAGHYLLLHRYIQKKHKNQGQKIGTGFIVSKNSLLRELNRGVDWIFSDHAITLQKILDQLLT